MKLLKDKSPQSFYLFLMVSAYVSTLGFGIFYLVAGVRPLIIIAFSSFILFVFFGLLSYFSVKLVLLFRLSIIVTLLSFSSQVYFTGGALSPAVIEFIIPPLLAFFYRPIRDRYYFMAISSSFILITWIASSLGLTYDLLPSELKMTHAMIVSLFVFSIVSVFTFLFRNTLARKNRQLAKSIQELQQTSEKLVHAEKMASLGMLSAGVAHEINNPLNFVKGGIDGLSQRIGKSEETAPFVNAIEEGVKRASSIVNSLRHFSRDSGDMNEPCYINDILDNCIIVLQHKLKYKVELERKYSVQRLRINGNEGKLHQAFLNILANAEQAIEKSGKIIVETRAKKNLAIVTITDDGVGIEPENLPKVAEPFFTTKPVGEGTGLGLSITQKIIEEHDGGIEILSEPGDGTKFTVRFNVATPV